MLPRHRRVLLLAALFLLALAIRLPYFHLVPRFEDEGLEVIRALEVSRGTNVPMIGYDIYYGPLFTVIVAALFRLLDADLLAARVVAVVAGALTVPAIYLLARMVANARVAIVAALLALTSPMLVVVGSHFGWSNSLTPLLATATLAAVYVGVTERRLMWLATGGFLAGLMVQSHPLSVVLVVALVVWHFVRCPPAEWFKRLEVYVAAVAFGIGYAPMLWILTGRPDQVIDAVQKQSYVYGPVESIGQYMDRLVSALTLLVTTIAGTGERLWAGFHDVPRLRRAIELAALGVVASGLVLSGRARSFLAIALLLPMLVLPLSTHALQSRYLLLLVPLACVCAGVALSSIWERGGWAPRLVATGALVAVLTVNLVAIVRVERRAIRDGDSNAAFFAVRDAVVRNGECQDHVFIEDTDALGLPPGEARTWTYFNAQAVRFVLTLAGCPQTAAPSGHLLDLVAARPDPVWLIVPEQSVTAFSSRVTLTRVLQVAPAPALPEALRLTLFRVEGTR